MSAADKPLVRLHSEIRTPPFSKEARLRAKRERLEAKGWKVGGAKEFLALSDQEAAYVELKSRLADGLRAKRRQRRLGQTELARLVESSQSRVAKMEAADRSVSIDLIIRSLFALGTSQPELRKILAR